MLRGRLNIAGLRHMPLGEENAQGVFERERALRIRLRGGLKL